MPLLKKEPSIFPEDLLSNGHLTDGREWFVGRTKPRQEKALARHFFQSQVHYYLPQYEKIWRSSGKTRRAWLPIFSGYVFFRGDGDDRYEALCTGRLAQTLEVPDITELEEDLKQVRLAELSERPLETLTDWFEPGRQVRIANGPLTGLEGIVIERRGKTRLIIRVRFIAQSVAVEVVPTDVEPL